VPQPPLPPKPPAPAPGPVAPGPNVTIAADSNAPTAFGAIYDRQTHEWAIPYVAPTRYRLRLNLSGVTATKAKPIRWQLSSPENRFNPFTIIDDGSVRAINGQKGVTAELPAAGPMQVTVTGPGASAGPRTINLKDYLVVSIGDSYSSGQGNPDQPGIPTAGSGARPRTIGGRAAPASMKSSGDGGLLLSM
jgi:hypothetical protein